jgi:hypothetical protein
MNTHPISTSRFLVVLLVLGCTDLPTDSGPIVAPSITFADLRGSWRNTDTEDELAYCVFDTVQPTFRIKVNYGHNFRWQNELTMSIRDNQLVGNTDQSTWYWLGLNSAKDTLSMCSDSFGTVRHRFVRDLTVGNLDDWMTTVYTPEYIDYPIPEPFLSQISDWSYHSFAYSDSTWFLLIRVGTDFTRLISIHLGTKQFKSLLLPGVDALDAYNGNLWCVRTGTIDIRRIADTTLVSQIALPFQENAYGIAVLSDKLYLFKSTSGGWVGQLLTLSNQGEVLRSYSTHWLADLAYIDQHLYCAHTSDFHEVDLSTGMALQSFVFSNYLGQPNAVATYGNRLAMVFRYPGKVRIGLLPPP